MKKSGFAFLIRVAAASGCLFAASGPALAGGLPGVSSWSVTEDSARSSTDSGPSLWERFLMVIGFNEAPYAGPFRAVTVSGDGASAAAPAKDRECRQQEAGAPEGESSESKADEIQTVAAGGPGPFIFAF